MKTRNRIVAAGLTAVAVAGLTVGVAVAADSSTGRTGPTSTTTVPIGTMDPATMADGSMMGDMLGMARMMGSDMGAMHDAMHTMMRDAMPDAALAACDQAHAAMADVTAPSPTTEPATSIDHAAHHSGG